MASNFMGPRQNVFKIKQASFENLKLFLNEQKEDLFSGSVLIAKDWEPIFEYSCGFADKSKNIGNKIDIKFNIGSMDKMFTAVAIAQLAQEGKLDFQKHISKYLPGYPKKVAEKVTIHQILTHTEGFPSYFNQKYIENRLNLETVNDYLELFKDAPLLFEPGSKYQYSNSGFVVLGAIIEVVSGLTYDEYTEERIFKAANMDNSGLFTKDDPTLAKGYTYRKPHSDEITKQLRTNDEDLPFRGGPAGGGYSTCLDLLNFAKALINHKLLSFDMTKIVLTPRENLGTKNGQTLYYGYGFQILDVGDGNLRYGHGGSFAGVNARLDIYPWLKLVVVVLSNYDPPSAFRVANKIGEVFLEN